MKKIAIFILGLILLLWFLHQFGVVGASPIDVPGCRRVNYPKVCADSYHKCDNIGLNDACLAGAQLDGFYGYDILRNSDKVMSHNVKTGDKHVESVEKP